MSLSGHRYLCWRWSLFKKYGATVVPKYALAEKVASAVGCDTPRVPETKDRSRCLIFFKTSLNSTTHLVEVYKGADFRILFLLAYSATIRLGTYKTCTVPQSQSPNLITLQAKQIMKELVSSEKFTLVQVYRKIIYLFVIPVVQRYLLDQICCFYNTRCFKHKKKVRRIVDKAFS